MYYLVDLWAYMISEDVNVPHKELGENAHFDPKIFRKSGIFYKLRHPFTDLSFIEGFACCSLIFRF